MSIFFNQTSACFIQSNQHECVIIKPTIINLPQHPPDLTKINIYNHTGQLIKINSNSKNDLMFSSFAAPAGSQIITLEPNRMLILNYILLDNKKKQGKWHVIRS